MGKSPVGLETSETPRELAFCAHAVLQPDEVFEVQDAHLEPRFSGSSLVTGEPGIRFDAGAPLVTVDGLPIGTVRVIDREPRALSASERKALQSLARQVVAQRELRQDHGRFGAREHDRSAEHTVEPTQSGPAIACSLGSSCPRALTAESADDRPGPFHAH